MPNSVSARHCSTDDVYDASCFEVQSSGHRSVFVEILRTRLDEERRPCIIQDTIAMFESEVFTWRELSKTAFLIRSQRTARTYDKDVCALQTEG